jgi:hypothetical protein
MKLERSWGRLGMKYKEITVALRFADNFAPPEGTILTHKNLIDILGYVWYGKLGATVSEKVVKQIMSNERPRTLLIHSGKIGRYWGYVDKIQYDVPPKEEIPYYYRENAGVFKTWFRLIGIEDAEKGVLGKCSVVSFGRPLSEVSKSSMSPYFIVNVEDE